MKLIVPILILLGTLFWWAFHLPSAKPVANQEPSRIPEPVIQPLPSIPSPSRQLISLRDTFASPSSETTRFKLMRALDREWESTFPFETVIGELASPGHPEDYLDYLAHALNRAIKKGQGRPTEQVRLHLAHPGVPIQAKTRLAPILVRLDDGPKSLALVSSLAQSAPSDSHRSPLLGALTLSRSAAPQLISALESMSSSPHRWPLSLAVALPPLAEAAHPGLEVPLVRILSQTNDSRLFSVAARASKRLPSSSQKTSIQNLVRERAIHFSAP